MITSIDISQVILEIHLLTALKSSLEHRHIFYDCFDYMGQISILSIFMQQMLTQVGPHLNFLPAPYFPQLITMTMPAWTFVMNLSDAGPVFSE